MPEASKITISEWWKYECKAFKRAKSEIGYSEFIKSGGGAVISGLFAYCVGWNNEHDAEIVVISAIVGFSGIFAIQFLIKLFSIPPKMVKEQQRHTNDLNLNFAAEKTELESQIQILQKKEGDKARRKNIKDELAGCRIIIQNLIGQLDGIEFYKYANEVRMGFESDYLGYQNTIYNFLNDKVGKSEATSLIDENKIPKVTLDPHRTFDLPAFRERWITQQFMFNRLKYMSEQLENIEDKLDSPHFILPA